MLRFSFLFIGLCAAVFFAEAQKRPNIVIIMADDLGFSDIGSYGGEIATPNLDKLAEAGIRYRQFYNAARCCPTRASLLTGLYPHQAGMGWMAAADLGTTPAYEGNLNEQCVTIAEVLKTAGYATYMTGKWHVTNERKIHGEVKDNWPLQRGFDRYFGIIPGGANYFTPVIYSGNKSFKAPADFYLTDAISDSSVKFVNEHFSGDSGNPFFMYVAYTAPHWPLHAPKQVIDKYKDVYKKGWDSIRQERFQKQQEIGLFRLGTMLSPKDTQVKDWVDLPDAEKEEMAMRMAIYAAQTEIMDRGIGAIVGALKKNNTLENTLIFFLSDNGACAEFISSGKSKAVDGSEETFESYRLPWANVSSTPYREYKHFTHEGGIATPLIVHWPAGIKRTLNNQFVSGYGHLTDIMATCVDVAAASYPATFKGTGILPLEGKSLYPHFSGKPNNRGRIYWEHEANIAVREGKWKLVAKTPEGAAFSTDAIQLFDMDADPTEMKDLGKTYPQLVRELYADWQRWAEKIGAFPLDTREYNVRMQAFRRNLNGSFDDNLGHWNIRTAGGNQLLVDESGQISGRKSALAVVESPEDRPGALSMFWPFKAEEGERFVVRLKSKSDKTTRFYLRLENVEQPGVKVIDQAVPVKQQIKAFEYASSAIPQKGMYRVALYFGGAGEHSKIWVDDVEMMAVKN